MGAQPSRAQTGRGGTARKAGLKSTRDRASLLAVPSRSLVERMRRPSSGASVSARAGVPLKTLAVAWSHFTPWHLAQTLKRRPSSMSFFRRFKTSPVQTDSTDCVKTFATLVRPSKSVQQVVTSPFHWMTN
jgi:hypothetical protein